MVLIGSPSVAMWTQFPAPGGGVEGLCCWQKTKPDGGWDPGAWDLWLHPARLSPIQAAHTVLGPWVSSNASLSQGRCSSLAEMLEQADSEGKEVGFSQERLFPASGSEPSITRQAAPEAEQSPGQRSQAPGKRTRGLGGGPEGLRAGRCQPCCRQGPGDPGSEPEPGDGENLSRPWGTHWPPAPPNPAGGEG